MSDYRGLGRAIAGLGQRIRAAVDDAGVGYASMQHVVTAAERETLRRLGVSLGQGYLLGRPAPAPTDSQASGLRKVEAGSPQ